MQADAFTMQVDAFTMQVAHIILLNLGNT